MAQRYIYLPDELNEKLKAEANASGLIQSLLFEHYKFSKSETIESLEAKEAEIKAKRDALNKALEAEESQIVTKKEIIEKEIEKIQTKQERDQEKFEAKKQSAKEYFKIFTQREMTDAEAEEYMEMLEQERIQSLGEYIELIAERETDLNKFNEDSARSHI